MYQLPGREAVFEECLVRLHPGKLTLWMCNKNPSRRGQRDVTEASKRNLKDRRLLTAL